MAKDFVVGVDVGGQTTKIGVVDTRGEVLSQTIIRSDIFGDDAAAYITALSAAIKENIAQAGKTLDDIRGIGVGAPNGNYYTGEVAFAPNLAWAANKAVPFARMLSEALGCLEAYYSAIGISRTAREWLECTDEPSSAPLHSLGNQLFR